MTKNRLFHITRKSDYSVWKNVIVKISLIIFAFLLFGLITTLIQPGSFTEFFNSLFLASFRNKNSFLATLYQFALLFGVCICLLPAFKMKFWNLGVAGQVMMGCIGSYMILHYLGPTCPQIITLILMLVCAIVFSVIWAVIPAIFKAQFRTNETLFTLMMNYIALCILRFFVKLWANNSSGGIDAKVEEYRKWGTWINGNLYTYYLIIAIIVIVLGVAVAIYLKRSKHGYEISVVGSSENTARYVGMDVKKIIIRTLMVSGLLCGILAFLFTTVNRNLSESFNTTGYGFSGILTLWCGAFNPIFAGLFSFLFAFANKGINSACGNLHISTYMTNVYVSILFLLIIGSDFFLNYKVHIDYHKKNKNPDQEEKQEISSEPIKEVK